MAVELGSGGIVSLDHSLSDKTPRTVTPQLFHVLLPAAASYRDCEVSQTTETSSWRLYL